MSIGDLADALPGDTPTGDPEPGGSGGTYATGGHRKN